MTDLLVFAVDVGWTTSRPVVPDQFVSRVVVAALTEAEAVTTAALMVMRPGVQMPTSTTVVRVTI